MHDNLLNVYNGPSLRAGGRVIASPYARKLAREAGVDVGDASGSGPNGRVVAADVQQLISSGGDEVEAWRVGRQGSGPDQGNWT